MPAYRNHLAASHGNLANLRDFQGKYADAAAAYRAAQSLLKQLVDDFPSVPVYREDLARGHNNLAIHLESMGQREEAEAAHKTGLKIQEQLVADFPGVMEYTLELGRNYTLRGRMIAGRGEPRESLEWYAKAIGILEISFNRESRLVTARQYLAKAHWNRAIALDVLRRHDDALRDWDRAIALSDGPDKADFEEHRLASSILGILRRESAWQLLWGLPKF